MNKQLKLITSVLLFIILIEIGYLGYSSRSSFSKSKDPKVIEVVDFSKKQNSSKNLNALFEFLDEKIQNGFIEEARIKYLLSGTLLRFGKASSQEIKDSNFSPFLSTDVYHLSIQLSNNEKEVIYFDTKDLKYFEFYLKKPNGLSPIEINDFKPGDKVSLVREININPKPDDPIIFTQLIKNP